MGDPPFPVELAQTMDAAKDSLMVATRRAFVAAGNGALSGLPPEDSASFRTFPLKAKHGRVEER